MSWASSNFDSWASTLDKWFDTPSGESWKNALREAALSRLPDSFDASAFAERAASLTEHLPELGDWVPRNFNTLFRPDLLPGPRNLPRGAMPAVGVPSAPSVPDRDGLLLVLAVVVAAVLLIALWRGLGVYRDRRAQAAAWRLGPWPVLPGDVSTRGELVRAFEYLALLCLGPAARTLHHRELAARLGARPSWDAQRSRDAADELAGLYEQARYTPDDERLEEEQLVAARRDLSYLAGVSAS
jgi:hypothetical protein